MISLVERTCTECDRTLPVDSFYPRRNRGEGSYTSYCKECSVERAQARRRAKPEEHRAASRRWQARNRFRVALKQSAYIAEKKGHEPCSATVAEIKEAFTGYCAICGAEEKKRKLCMDHDHSTGQFRGWLCHTCNQGIGCFRDDSELLERAAEFIS